MKNFLLIIPIYLILMASVKGVLGKDLSGYLIYSAGNNKIHILNLETIEEKEIYKGDKHYFFINNITYGPNGKLIFSEGFANWEILIKELDLSDGTIKTLGNGFYATYIRESKKLFYYFQANKAAKIELRLAEGFDLKNSKTLALAPPPYVRPNGNGINLYGPPIQVSDKEIVFVGEDQKLWKYDFLNNQYHSFNNIPICIPSVWRAKNKTLICEDLDAGNFAQVNLDTLEITHLDLFHDWGNLFYLSEYDALIGIEAWPNLLKMQLESYYLYIFI